jgi:precorrin-2 dehydrogenase / sirohydrochlorin ferrochelatase
VAFDYPVNLNLEGRRAVVFGGGGLAVGRIEGLLASGATVTVIAPSPDPALRDLPVRLIERPGVPADLAGAFIAIATGEDDTPIDPLWEAAEEAGVLFASLDDIPRSHFGAASIVRRGDLRITISTAGKAPALSKRLRLRLEEQFDPAYGELVEALHRARQRLLPRTVPFADWAARWGEAVADLDHLLDQVRAGETGEVEEHVVRTVRSGDGARS